MVSSCGFTHLMPQSATFAPFRTAIPAISHFDLFGLRPENWGKFTGGEFFVGEFTRVGNLNGEKNSTGAIFWIPSFDISTAVIKIFLLGITSN